MCVGDLLHCKDAVAVRRFKDLTFQDSYHMFVYSYVVSGNLIQIICTVIVSSIPT